MPDWLIAWLGQMQGGIVRTLAAELRAGGLGTAGLAFALGALHALTPGHGKAALAAYFLGREARIVRGLRVALAAALLHVLTGLAAFLVLRLVVGTTPSAFGRPSTGFTAFGYLLIVGAGVMMFAQSLRQGHDHPHAEGALTAGIGMLPCPLTISVLGFAWSQSSSAMVAIVLMALALGIALTLGLVALIAIVARRSTGAAFAPHIPSLDRWSRIIQGLAGAAIVTFGVYVMLRL